jgi:hypothetical protein
MKDIIQQNNTEELSKKEKRKALRRAYNASETAKAYRRADRRAYSAQEVVKLKAKAYREANKEKLTVQFQQYYEANKEKYKAQDRQRYQANKEKLKINYQTNNDTINAKRKRKVCRRAYYAKRKEYINERLKHRRLHDPLFRFVHALRCHSSRAFKRIGQSKPSKTLHLLGCSWEEAKERFESLFQPGMNWNNYGKWHIDHIIPLASATTIDEAKALNHISNLQPLWAVDNFIKGAKLISLSTFEHRCLLLPSSD